MDSVFDAQFRNMRDAFLRRGVDVRVAYRPDGDVDYLYQAGRILTRRGDLRASRDNLERVLPGIQPAPDDERRSGSRALEDVAVWSVEALDEGRMTVPEVLDL